MHLKIETELSPYARGAVTSLNRAQHHVAMLEVFLKFA